MKKFLGILAIAGTLVACGNSGESTTTTDTTSTTTDTTTMAPVTPAPADTTGGATMGTDTSAGAAADTTSN